MVRSVREFGAPEQISTCFASWLRYRSDVTRRRPNKLCTMFGRLLGWYTMYIFRGLLHPGGILPGAKVTFRLSLAFSYIGSDTARHSSSGRQPNFAAHSTRNGIAELLQRAPPIFGWASITLGIGPHSSFINFVPRIRFTSYMFKRGKASVRL